MTQNFYAGVCMAILLAALSFTLTGCCHQQICVQAVDAATTEPLAGVVTEWRQDRHQMFLSIAHYGPIKLPSSGQDGTVEVKGVRRTWESHFVFSRPGYSNVYGSYYSGGSFYLSKHVSYFPPGPFEGEFRLEGKPETAVESNGCFLVTMSKAE